MTDEGNANGKDGAGRGIEIKDTLRRPLPKRFYTSVATEARSGAYAIMLDGRSVRTPAKRELALSSAPLAEAVAEEWRAQGTRIDPSTMPLTRLANSAIDAVQDRMEDVADDVAAYAGSDLVCYRAEAPASLVRRQHEAWDPVLAWARRDLGAVLVVQEGVMHVSQPPEALTAVRAALSHLDALTLSALHVLTTISGSALLALAVLKRRLTADEAWAAATVDETWQSEQWGRDAEAEAQSALKRAEFEAASRCLSLLSPRR